MNTIPTPEDLSRLDADAKRKQAIAASRQSEVSKFKEAATAAQSKRKAAIDPKSLQVAKDEQSAAEHSLEAASNSLGIAEAEYLGAAENLNIARAQVEAERQRQEREARVKRVEALIPSHVHGIVEARDAVREIESILMELRRTSDGALADQLAEKHRLALLDVEVKNFRPPSRHAFGAVA